MKIVLGNFKLWRIKKFLVFTICMWISISILFRAKSDRFSSIFILIGLVLYAIIIDLPWVKNCINEIYVEDTDEEIKYGGKWLDTIGYRLIIKADKKYIFDSLLINENVSFKKSDFNKLLQLFKNVEQ